MKIQGVITATVEHQAQNIKERSAKVSLLSSYVLLARYFDKNASFAGHVVLQMQCTMLVLESVIYLFNNTHSLMCIIAVYLLACFDLCWTFIQSCVLFLKFQGLIPVRVEV